MRGNDELNETKLQAIAKTTTLRPATNDELIKYFGASGGSIGPVGIKKEIKVVADNLLKDANGMVSGANKDGFHLKNIDLRRDANIEEYLDLRTIQEGEICEQDKQPLRIVKAIELGHIFKLGTKYSEALEAYFVDNEGNEKPIIMGSYSIGIERIMACYIEQNYDDKGIVWNKALAPFDIHLLGLNIHKSEEVNIACQKVITELESAGLDVLFDDREVSPGVKFNDADLIGIPIQIIIGQKNLKEGKVEIKERQTDNRHIVMIEDIVRFIELQLS
jgi:prolyl-tRNA synthetase